MISPETRSATAQQCAYISSDTSIAANIQALHDRNVTAGDVARIRSAMPKKRQPALTWGSTGPITGPSERPFVVRALLTDANRVYVTRMVETGQVASWPALAAWAAKHGDSELAQAALERVA